MSQSTLGFVPTPVAHGGNSSTFAFGTHAVRVVMREGGPWFVAADVCGALDYANASKAVTDHLDDDERSTITNSESRNGGGKLVIINESGLYALVLRSRKPEARKFAKWVTSEVLPSIRKTGSYTSPSQMRDDQIRTIANTTVAAYLTARVTECVMSKVFLSYLGDTNGETIRKRWILDFERFNGNPEPRLTEIDSPVDLVKAALKTATSAEITDMLVACGLKLARHS